MKMATTRSAQGTVPSLSKKFSFFDVKTIRQAELMMPKMEMASKYSSHFPMPIALSGSHLLLNFLMASFSVLY